MKSWSEFSIEEPELAKIGKGLLFQSRPHVGLAFLATLRNDGAPRLHPVSIVLAHGRLFVLIPPTSPKCRDLQRDGRFAMQAFPPPQNEANEEFYLSGRAEPIQDHAICQALIEETKIAVEEHEVLFELFFDRVMYTRLESQGTPDERPLHKKWQDKPSSC
jgi:hypothetical protein